MPRRDPVNRLVHVYACDGLAASGKVVAEGMAEAFNLPLSRIEVIYYGVDAVHFSPGERDDLRREWGVGSDDFLIGMVGRVDRVKGLGNFLHAAALAGHDTAAARRAGRVVTAPAVVTLCHLHHCQHVRSFVPAARA